MAKAKRQYVCQNCGCATYRWQGQCADCGEWNTLVEEATAAARAMEEQAHQLAEAVALFQLEENATATAAVGNRNRRPAAEPAPTLERPAETRARPREDVVVAEAADSDWQEF